VGTGKWTGEQRWVAILVAAALLVLIGVLGVPLGPLRIAAGILVTFCAPGYILLPIMQPRRLAAIARFILSVPLSMALAIAWGVVLNLSPFGVYPEGLAAGMALSALIFFGIAARLRRPGMPNLPTTVRDRWWQTTAGRSRVRTRRTLPLPQIAGVLLALLLIGTWTGVGLYRGSREAPTRFTEFYVISTTPVGLDGTTLRLGVRNREGATKRYQLKAKRNTSPEQSDATPTVGHNTFAVEQEVAVADSEEGIAEMRLDLLCGDGIDATLNMAGDGTASVPYRTVRVRPACAPGTSGNPPSPATRGTVMSERATVGATLSSQKRFPQRAAP